LPLEWELFGTTLSTVAELAFGKRSRSALRRLRLALFDREHESSENHCPQNPGCKPRCITIVTFDYVACHWNTSLCSDLLAFWTWFPHSGYTLNKWVGEKRKPLADPVGTVCEWHQTSCGEFIENGAAPKSKTDSHSAWLARRTRDRRRRPAVLPAWTVPTQRLSRVAPRSCERVHKAPPLRKDGGCGAGIRAAE